MPNLKIDLVVDDNSKDIIDRTVKPIYSVSQTIDDLLYLIFGNFSNYINKKHLKHEHELSTFKAELHDKINKIPSEELIEPKLSIVGPALESSKYYYEEPVLRNLFSSLIASSVNSKTSNNVHPAFIEIIKQLSPLDAKILSNNFKFDKIHPICKVVIQNSNKPLIDDAEKKMNYFFQPASASNQIFINYFLTQVENDQDLISVSIANLTRLGLLETSYTKYQNSLDLYKVFEKDQFFTEHIIPAFKEFQIFSKEANISENTNKYLCLIRGAVTTTPLGENFISTCC